jgi:hypothetical protein
LNLSFMLGIAAQLSKIFNRGMVFKHHALCTFNQYSLEWLLGCIHLNTTDHGALKLSSSKGVDDLSDCFVIIFLDGLNACLRYSTDWHSTSIEVFTKVKDASMDLERTFFI